MIVKFSFIFENLFPFFYPSGSTLSDETYESLIYFLSFHLETDHSITDAQEAELYHRVRGGKRYNEVLSKIEPSLAYLYMYVSWSFLCLYIAVCNYLERKSPPPLSRTHKTYAGSFGNQIYNHAFVSRLDKLTITFHSYFVNLKF